MVWTAKRKSDEKIPNVGLTHQVPVHAATAVWSLDSDRKEIDRDEVDKNVGKTHPPCETSK